MAIDGFLSGADSQDMVVDELGGIEARLSHASQKSGGVNGLSSSQLKKAAELEEIDQIMEEIIGVDSDEDQGDKVLVENLEAENQEFSPT